MPLLAPLPVKLKPTTLNAPMMSFSFDADGLDLTHGLRGVLHRRALRRLHGDHEPALVLVRHEAGRHNLVDEVRRGKSGEEQHQHKIAHADCPLSADGT